MGAGQNIRIRHHDDTLGWIAAEKPGRQCHRCAQRFECARRQGDDQATNLSRRDLGQLFGDGLEVPIWLKSDAWPHDAEGELRKGGQVSCE
jgi:hypothetical protein